MIRYSLNGAYPAPLPERFITPEGLVRTSPEQWTLEELAEWGFVEVADPMFDPETQQADWIDGAWVVTDLPEPPAPEPIPPVPVLTAVANLGIVNGDITGVETASGLTAALYLGPGQYWAFFAEPQPDTNYIAAASASSPGACISMRTEDFVEISVIDGSGANYDPSEVSLQIYRVQ